ncbi:MAG: DNA methyltransferase [Candidatus Obscuribacter sp.]|nr:DNA methyltransferase [Candidatus Obscuribacter sp.]
MSKTVHHLKMQHESKLPDHFPEDVRYTRTLVEQYLKRFTTPNDLVLDPFMGFGTTLVVAESMKRRAVGVEFDSARCDYVKSLLSESNADWVLCGDSRQISKLNLPQIDFSITSPPYMGKNHTENPFTAYSTLGDGYQAYLQDLKNIYAQIATLLKPGAHVVIEVSNLKHEDGTLTTLAWDLAREVSLVLDFQGEEIIAWEPTYAYGYDHSYCLVFKK